MAGRMKLHLKRLSIWPIIKVTFLVSIVFGFLVGLMMALFFGFFMALASSFDPNGAKDFGIASAGIMVVFLPIFYAFAIAVGNTLFALVSAAVYNFVARTMGGLEYEVEVMEGNSLSQVEAAVPAPPSQPSSPPPPSPPPPPRPEEPPTDYSI